MIIEDGSGFGYSAKVDDHGRLTTAANVITHKQHHATYHKNLYAIHFDVVLAGTSETNVAFFKNIDSTKDFELYDVTVSSDSDVEVAVNFFDNYTSGGNIITPVNTNMSSGTSLSTNTATVYEGGSSANLVLDTTNRQKISDFFMLAREQVTILNDGAIIITNDKAYSISATGVASDKVTVTMLVAYHTAGTKL